MAHVSVLGGTFTDLCAVVNKFLLVAGDDLLLSAGVALSWVSVRLALLSVTSSQ